MSLWSFGAWRQLAIGLSLLLSVTAVGLPKNECVAKSVTKRSLLGDLNASRTFSTCPADVIC
ncbi:hypothetical protein C2E31_03525 [Rhodopirellula baltica]|nr:hypothetical protein C2E31_03525 [Rhodopirellula baltica]